jgi:hypothetical protein
MKPANERTNLEIAQVLSEAQTGDDFAEVCREASRRMMAADGREAVDRLLLEAATRTLRELAMADIMRASVRQALETTAKQLERMASRRGGEG